MTAYPEEPSRQQGAYGEVLANLQEQYSCVRIRAAQAGPLEVPIQDPNLAAVPFTATVDGVPYDTIATISIGRHRGGLSGSTGQTAELVNGAMWTYAIVRRAYTDEDPQVLALTPEEARLGTCAVDTAKGQGRPLAPLPRGGKFGETLPHQGEGIARVAIDAWRSNELKVGVHYPERGTYIIAAHNA